MFKSILMAAALVAATSLSAAALDAPAGDPVLAVSGDVTTTNSDGAAAFDFAMLEAMPQHSIRTSTPWHKGEVEFSGPLLRDVLSAVGADSDVIAVRALNDYEAEIPKGDWTGYDMILATRMNGDRMSVREQGPLFVVYPFDQQPELKDEVHYNRSVWQVREITVE